MRLRPLIAVVLLLASATAIAASGWINRVENGTMMAITPNHQLILRMDLKPNQSTWGELLIPLQPEQVAELNRHRKDKLFPYIEVAIEVDRYYRTAQGHIFGNELYVKTTLDVRQWEGLKKGKRLIVRLPDGSEYKESLSGSGKALREVERHYR